MSEELKDFYELLIIKNHLIKVPIEDLKKAYKSNEDFLWFLDAIALLTQKEKGFLLLSDEIKKRIITVIEDHKFDCDSETLEVINDTIVYFLHHTEKTETGKIKAKTSGKMLDNQLTLEGLFSIVLLCKTDGKEHYFETQSDGFTTCKSPMEMFEPRIDNDLKKVDTTIREYYELNKNESEEN